MLAQDTKMLADETLAAETLSEDAGPRCEDAGRRESGRGDSCLKMLTAKTLAAETLSKDAGPRRKDAGREDVKTPAAKMLATLAPNAPAAKTRNEGMNCWFLSATATAGLRIFSLCPFFLCLLVLDRVGSVMGSHI